jgi:hypothetical protein
MRKVGAKEADALVGKDWFDGYAKSVDVHDESVTLDELDAEARAEALGRPEYVVFARDLTVTGTLNLCSDVHSIFVVLGTLTVRRLILGDAVLVVRGKLRATEWVLGPPSEGLLDLGSEQMESDPEAVLARIDSPLVVLFDRSRREYTLRERGRMRSEQELGPDLLDDGDVLHRLLRERVIRGESIFR